MPKNNNLVQMIITLKSGAEYECSGTAYEACMLHNHVQKYLSGIRAKTNDYTLVKFGGRVFVSSEIAMYTAQDVNGRDITFDI